METKTFAHLIFKNLYSSKGTNFSLTIAHFQITRFPHKYPPKASDIG